MNTFVVERFGGGKRGTFFTLRRSDSLVSETDAFFRKAMEDVPDAAETLALKMERMIHYTGFQEQYFKTGEGSRGDAVCALSEGKLRLYCLRYGNIAVILGGGGVKQTRTYQEDAVLHSKVKLMQALNRELDRLMKEGTVRMTEDGFTFDLPLEVSI